MITAGSSFVFLLLLFLEDLEDASEILLTVSSSLTIELDFDSPS
jgi:hypothetical protein